MLRLGTMTRWGKVQAVGFRDGERWYMMIDKHGVVSLMPGPVVESLEAGEVARTGREEGVGRWAR